jgi:hypothetical protein
MSDLFWLPICYWSLVDSKDTSDELIQMRQDFVSTFGGLAFIL